MQKMKNKHKSNNKGFSLVEMIIVISIIAILMGIMVPQLIKYIYKAKKSADIQTCDAIGSVFNDLMYDVTDPAGVAMYEYVQESAGYLNSSKYSSPNAYRVLATMNARPNYKTNKSDGYRHKLQIQNFNKYKNRGIEEKFMEACADIQDLQFSKAETMDSYVICCDEDMKIYVFLGGGINGDTWFITKDSIEDCYYNSGNKNIKLYMVYPEVSADYLSLKTPNDCKRLDGK